MSSGHGHDNVSPLYDASVKFCIINIQLRITTFRNELHNQIRIIVLISRVGKCYTFHTCYRFVWVYRIIQIWCDVLRTFAWHGRKSSEQGGCFSTLVELPKWVLIVAYFRGRKQYFSSYGMLCITNYTTEAISRTRHPRMGNYTEIHLGNSPSVVEQAPGMKPRLVLVTLTGIMLIRQNNITKRVC